MPTYDEIARRAYEIYLNNGADKENLNRTGIKPNMNCVTKELEPPCSLE